jgi:glutamate-5-semialdehyde dehydrogenase
MDDAGAAPFVASSASLDGVGALARAASEALRLASAEARTRAIEGMASAILTRSAAILAANAADIAAAGQLSPAMIDRLTLTSARIDAMAQAVRAIAAIPDPLGVETARWTPANGLDIARVRTPIGVIAMIYEARPNVTADAAALCVRSGNAVILRGGSECLRSSLAINAAVVEGLTAAGLPAGAVQMMASADRAAVGELLSGLDGSIDLIIPRGGKGLVERVQREARVAVLGHAEGLNHTYVHAAADPTKARAIVVNAKMRRVSVCGATETLLIDAEAAAVMLADIVTELTAAGCEVRGDGRARALVPTLSEAVEEDWSTEYLEPIISVRIVDGLDEAVAHIARYGSGHTDAIVTEDSAAAEAFAARVDSAIVLINASTQFADGGEFGFGGEIGIATGRLHARGPVGAEQLTTFKYVVRGSGQTRP